MPLRPRTRGCPFLWLLSFGQAKESNWPPWMADKKHTDVSRLSQRPKRRTNPPSPQPSPASGRGKTRGLLCFDETDFGARRGKRLLHRIEITRRADEQHDDILERSRARVLERGDDEVRRRLRLRPAERHHVARQHA